MVDKKTSNCASSVELVLVSLFEKEERDTSFCILKSSATSLDCAVTSRR